jgi:hypothetical protein
MIWFLAEMITLHVFVCLFVCLYVSEFFLIKWVTLTALFIKRNGLEITPSSPNKLPLGVISGRTSGPTKAPYLLLRSIFSKERERVVIP